MVARSIRSKNCICFLQRLDLQMQGSGLDDPMSSILFKKGLSRKQTQGQFLVNQVFLFRSLSIHAYGTCSILKWFRRLFFGTQTCHCPRITLWHGTIGQILYGRWPGGWRLLYERAPLGEREGHGPVGGPCTLMNWWSWRACCLHFIASHMDSQLLWAPKNFPSGLKILMLLKLAIFMHSAFLHKCHPSEHKANLISSK